jgi:hypothetical protein
VHSADLWRRTLLMTEQPAWRRLVPAEHLQLSRHDSTTCTMAFTRQYV